ncbi:MAG: 2-oxoacid:acceptor oxidoreductase family protein [Pseudomonadota bacterium]
MYRIRFHGRGGQGMKVASRILGSAFFAAGFEVQDAPRYGAERRGAPLFAYVRADRKPINERGIIRHPDLAVVADDTLVAVPAAGVLAGLDTHSILLINSREPAQVWRDRLNSPARILILPVVEEAADRAEMPHIGATCAAAAARLVGVIPREAFEQAIRTELHHLGEAVVNRNLEVALAAYARMEGQQEAVRQGDEADASDYSPPAWTELPFEDASISAPVIHAGLTSEQARTGLWRTLRPVVEYERCRHCWWVCSSLCPDGAIRVEQERPVIDYDHCKGCMVCVAVCPPHAILAQPEHEAAAEEHST